MKLKIVCNDHTEGNQLFIILKPYFELSGFLKKGNGEMGKEEKQFPLTLVKNCQIYLNRIISSCELCMDKLKQYNEDLARTVEEYKGQNRVPYDIYSDYMDRTYNAMAYLVIIRQIP